MHKIRSIVVSTGAGISAESGLKTFRDNNGLWENHRVEDVATPEAFQRNPKLVHGFYNQRRNQLKDAHPNSAHIALAEFEKNFGGGFLLVTQNVDDLHDRAGSKNLLHMHGELKKIRCELCEAKFSWVTDLSTETPCPGCAKKSALRPDIVWFGEMPYHMEDIYKKLETCDLFVSIGTSGNVYPAAGFAQAAKKARKVEINLEPSLVANDFDEHLVGRATEQVPKFFEQFAAL